MNIKKESHSRLVGYIHNTVSYTTVLWNPTVIYNNVTHKSKWNDKDTTTADITTAGMYKTVQWNPSVIYDSITYITVQLWQGNNHNNYNNSSSNKPQKIIYI